MSLRTGILFPNNLFLGNESLTNLQATLGFFALPNDPLEVVNPLIDNLITLLCAILLTRYSICHRSMLCLIVYSSGALNLGCLQSFASNTLHKVLTL